MIGEAWMKPSHRDHWFKRGACSRSVYRTTCRGRSYDENSQRELSRSGFSPNQRSDFARLRPHSKLDPSFPSISLQSHRIKSEFDLEPAESCVLVIVEHG